MTRLADGEVFALPLLVEHYNGLVAAVNSLTTGYGLTCACLQWRVGGRLLSLLPGCGITDADGKPIPEPLDCFASFPGEGDMVTLANYLGIPVNGPPTLPGAPEVPQNLAVIFSGTVSGGVTAASCPEGGGWGTVTVSWSTTLTPHPLPPGNLAKGIAPSGRGWTPGPLPPDGSGAGDYYVCTRSGWDGSTYWLKGDVLVWHPGSYDGFGFPSTGSWERLSAAQHSPGFAYVPATGQWIQIDAQAANGVVATNFLGLWDPTTNYPAAGTNRGDYYTIHGTSRARNAFDGGKLIWDGNAWQVSNSNYADFHWLSITDVKGFMESLGFSMVFNELCIPVHLDWEEQGTGPAPYGAYAASGSQQIATVWSYFSTGAGNTPLQAAQGIPVLPMSPCVTTRTGPTGARWQFTTATEDDPSEPDYPAWKIRARLRALE